MFALKVFYCHTHCHFSNVLYFDDGDTHTKATPSHKIQKTLDMVNSIAAYLLNNAEDDLKFYEHRDCVQSAREKNVHSKILHVIIINVLGCLNCCLNAYKKGENGRARA